MSQNKEAVEKRRKEIAEEKSIKKEKQNDKSKIKKNSCI